MTNKDSLCVVLTFTDETDGADDDADDGEGPQDPSDDGARGRALGQLSPLCRSGRERERERES